jgi:carbon monoxide dehydrogenase subunit G
MNVNLERTLVIPAPLDRVWPIVRDVPKAAACAPGAEIGAEISPGVYRCDLGLKVGPFTLGYKATLQVDVLDPATHSARFTIRSLPGSGAGGSLVVRIVTSAFASGAHTRLLVRNEIAIDGPAARFGPKAIERAGGRALDRFAENLAALM